MFSGRANAKVLRILEANPSRPWNCSSPLRNLNWSRFYHGATCWFSSFFLSIPQAMSAEIRFEERLLRLWPCLWWVLVLRLGSSKWSPVWCLLGDHLACASQFRQPVYILCAPAFKGECFSCHSGHSTGDFQALSRSTCRRARLWKSRARRRSLAGTFGGTRCQGWCSARQTPSELSKKNASHCHKAKLFWGSKPRHRQRACVRSPKAQNCR